jgi:hypothetical protein
VDSAVAVVVSGLLATGVSATGALALFFADDEVSFAWRGGIFLYKNELSLSQNFCGSENEPLKKFFF